MKSDDEFLLTPLEDSTEPQESDSGSQVIALAPEGEGLLSDTTDVGGMASMLEEDAAAQPSLGLGMAGPALAMQPSSTVEGAPFVQSTSALPEQPYSGLMIGLLAVCAFLLMLCGMMMFDLLRSMWGEAQPFAVTSSLMDMILHLFEGK
jgi:hypothetical protein